MTWDGLISLCKHCLVYHSLCIKKSYKQGSSKTNLQNYKRRQFNDNCKARMFGVEHLFIYARLNKKGNPLSSLNGSKTMSTCLLFSRCLMRAALVHQLGNCINFVHCDDHFFILISFPQFIYDLFSYIINTHFFHVNVGTHN